MNLLYELSHSLLYKTCLEAPLKKYVYLMCKATVFDGLSIAVFYFLGFWLFPKYFLIAFFVTALLFAYVWEIYSLKVGKWEYSAAMPIVFSVGITPLIQLALTGLLSIYIIAYFFV